MARRNILDQPHCWYQLDTAAKRCCTWTAELDINEIAMYNSTTSNWWVQIQVIIPEPHEPWRCKTKYLLHAKERIPNNLHSQEWKKLLNWPMEIWISFPYQSLREYKTSGKKYLAIIAYAMKKVGIGQVQETCVEAKDLNILFFLPKYS
jgi:hypothetical protein